MTDTLTDAILRDMPGLPRDVAEHWLAPHAARDGVGWPPPDEGQAPPWSDLLLARPLGWWRDRLWHLEPLPMVLEYMSNAARMQVTRLAEAARAGRDVMPDSRARIASVRADLRTHGTWSVPVVAFPDSDGLGLADGHHRLAALHLERSEGRSALKERHAVWLALPRNPVPPRMG